MDFGIATVFISYVIMIFMVTGYSIIGTLKKDLDSLDDMQRIDVEAFLMEYYDADFIGRVRFILLHGARLWAMIFTQWYWDRKEK